MGAIKIALDAMGGDFAPAAEVEGGVSACREYGIELVLVGDEKRITVELQKHPAEGLPISILHSDQVVTMEDAPSMVIRRKRNSSIWKATELVQEGIDLFSLIAEHAPEYLAHGPIDRLALPPRALFPARAELAPNAETRPRSARHYGCQ